MVGRIAGMVGGWAIYVLPGSVDPTELIEFITVPLHTLSNTEPLQLVRAQQNLAVTLADDKSFDDAEWRP